MKKIHLLTPYKTETSLAMFFPLTIHAHKLRERGLDFRFFFKRDKDLLSGDALWVDSQCLRGLTRDQHTEFYQFLKEAHTRLPIVWLDTYDGTGITHFEVMPYVQGYFKTQILKDKRKYMQHYYGNRIFCDYYHKQFGIEDKDSGFKPALLKEGDIDKLDVSWGFGLGDFGLLSKTHPKKRDALYRLLSKYFSLSSFYSAQFIAPSEHRSIDAICRFSSNYKRATINYHRRQIMQILEKEHQVKSAFVPRWEYFKDLRNAKVAVSPFGYGETSLRDYEITMNGAALLKPDMTHLSSWPEELYVANETYMPHHWDLSDVGHALEKLLENKRFYKIASNTQERYYFYIRTKEGHQAFCARVEELFKRTMK
jgi:hypothetical protein